MSDTGSSEPLVVVIGGIVDHHCLNFFFVIHVHKIKSCGQSISYNINFWWVYSFLYIVQLMETSSCLVSFCRISWSLYSLDEHILLLKDFFFFIKNIFYSGIHFSTYLTYSSGFSVVQVFIEILNVNQRYLVPPYSSRWQLFKACGYLVKNVDEWLMHAKLKVTWPYRLQDFVLTIYMYFSTYKIPLSRNVTLYVILVKAF